MDQFWDSIIDSIRETSGVAFDHPKANPVGGGCINQAFLLGEDGGAVSSVFVKVNTEEKHSMFEAEAEALSALAATGTIRVPNPLCYGCSEGKAFLALEAIPMNSRSDAISQGKMGEQLAALHRVTSENGQFGWHRDNTIGELPQRNSWTATWVEFFGRQRLKPQFEMARSKGRLFPKAGELLERLPELLGDHEPEPSLLHGDLWGGNAAFDAGGEPVIYDPATYYGDRETDLAFTEMFGGFGPAFYENYAAVFPINSGYGTRKPLYNLYHVLNHANHFGGGYAAQAESIINQVLSD